LLLPRRTAIERCSLIHRVIWFKTAMRWQGFARFADGPRFRSRH
jgi:hypothetical protein